MLWSPELDTAARIWRACFDAETGPRYECRNRPGLAPRIASLPDGGLPIELTEGP